MLKRSRPLACMFALLIVLFAGLSVVDTHAQTGGATASATNKSSPLYLHWFKPWYAGNETPPEHILTLRVTVSEEFVVVFSDPKLKRRKIKIEGRIDERNGKHLADIRANWLSVEGFQSELKLDEPCNGTMVAFSGAYFPTQIAISHDRSAKPLLAHAAAAAHANEVEKPE